MVRVVLEIQTITRVLMIINCLLQMWNSLTMNRMLETLSMWVTVSETNKAYFKIYMAKEKFNITRITAEAETKEITTLLVQATLHRGKYSELCGTVLAEQTSHQTKFKEVASPSPVPFLARQMLILRSKCTETETSETTSNRKRKRTWTWCSTISMAPPSAQRTIRPRTSTSRAAIWMTKAKRVCQPSE